MSNLTDAELISEYQNTQSNEAFLQILERYQPLILKTINHWSIKYYDKEDLLQEAHFECHKALLSFKFDKGVTFGYYFKNNLNRRYFSLMRAAFAKKREINQHITSIDAHSPAVAENMLGIDRNFHSPEHAALIKEGVREFTQRNNQLENEIMRQLTSKNPLSTDEIIEKLDKFNAQKYHFYNLKRSFKNDINMKSYF